MSTYTPIASQTLGSTSANVTFSSIPQGYTDLVLVVQAKAATTDDNIYLRFNSDSGSNYSVTNMSGNGSSAASTRFSNTSFIWFDYFGYLRTSSFSTIIMNFQNYSNSTTNKTCLIRNNIDSVGVTASVGLWRNTAPITAINLLTSGFASGSTFSIYGIAGGDVTAKAAGGIVTTSGGYAYHTFTSSGAFIPSETLTVDYLVVAGGGGGGYRNANAGGTGGGGAGGMRCTVTASGGTPGTVESALSLSANYAYPVIVGAGGAPATTQFIKGFNGGNSVFASITSVGGGGGGSTQANSSPGAIGGSGGGAGWDGTGTDVGGTGTANQGFAGGEVNGNVYTGGAGGGGASAVGSNAGTNGPNGGANGGNGVATSITGSSVTYAGGGAGGEYIGGGVGTGGAGGGGNSSTAGTINTGGGGGGGSGSSSASAGATGGSGIVIIRYAI